MQIQLTKEHEDWLRAQVADGRFSSLDEAVAEAIDFLKSSDDDLAWAKPLVDEGLAELDRGEAGPAEEVFARIRRAIAVEDVWRGFASLRQLRATCRKSQTTLSLRQASAWRSVFVGRMRRSLDGLVDFPRMGRSRPGFGPGVTILGPYPYVAF